MLYISTITLIVEISIIYYFNAVLYKLIYKFSLIKLIFLIIIIRFLAYSTNRYIS